MARYYRRRGRLSGHGLKALVHRWRRQIESGQARSITDLGEQVGVTDADVCRLLSLTCLAPDMVEPSLDRGQVRELTPAEVLREISLVWEDPQRRRSSRATATHQLAEV